MVSSWPRLIDQFLLLTCTVIWTIYASKGGCRHVYYLSAARQALLIKINWISQPFCAMAIATGKVSVAFLILRILGVAGLWKRRLLQFIIYSVFLCATVDILLTVTQCVPMRALWTPSAALRAKCFSPSILTIFALSASSKLIRTPRMNAAKKYRLLCLGGSVPGPFAYCNYQGSPSE